MISPKIQTAINDQINFELFSAYLYASMSTYYLSINLPGFANWMRVQVQEEMAHATFMFDYLNERGGRVLLQPIAGPQTEWNDPAEPFKQAYEHELEVTRRINNIINIAMDERDHATMNFYQWFVKEQVEEEANSDGVNKQMILIGNDRSGLFMIDRELATRVFMPPVMV
jgi:ferritin